MALNANNGSPRLGIGVNPNNLNYLSDATLQVGWSGNSATFKYVDGNQTVVEYLKPQQQQPQQ
jgi:hypothetical protein